VRYKEFLNEYNRDITKRQYGNKIVDRLKSGPDRNYFLDVFNHLNQKSNFADDTEKIWDEIAQNLLASFENNDPTPNNQYTPWIAREYVAGNIRRLEDLSRVSEALKIYHQYKNKRIFKELFPMFPQYKDIGKLDASELENIAEKLNHAAGMAKTQDKGQAEEVYQDSDVRVIVPLDEKAACYYGQGTRWCTAATQGQNYFEHYNSQGSLYIIIPKKPRYPGEKYQLHVYEEQFMDEKDDPVGPSELLRFPGFVKFLKFQEPSISDLLQFSDPEVIEGINKFAAEKIAEWTFEDLMDWEMQDDSWNDYRSEVAIEKGYVDEEGDVDWDRVFEDPKLNDYFEYNDEAREIYNNALEIAKWTPAQMINDIETSEYSPDGNWFTLRNLEDLYAAYAEENLTSDVVDKIKGRLFITNDPNRYKNTTADSAKFGDFTVGVVGKPYRR
jgi:hypothetical protein